MQGLEILTSTQVVTDYTFNTMVFWIVAIIVVGIFVVIGISEDNVLQASIFGIVAGLLLGTLMGRVGSKPADYETQYKVTISDEVSMTEFLERYEIIDQNGKIFTIRERNENEGEGQ